MIGPRAVAAIVLVALTACAGGLVPQAEDEGPLPVRFLLSFTPTASRAGWYVGVDKGFYADEGLDVEVVPGESSHATISTLAAGAGDLGEPDLLSLILAKAERPDLPVTAVAPLYVRAPHAVYSLASGANITEPQDLEGAEVYLSATSVLDDLLAAWAEQHGVSDLRFGNLNPANQQQLLMSGHAPAILAFTPHRPVFEAAAAEAGEEVVVLELAAWGLDDFYGLMLAANDEFTADHPEAVRGFVRASIRAWRYAFDHPEEAGEVMQARFPATEPQATQSVLKVVEPLMTDGGRVEIGTFEPAKVAATLGWVQRALGVEHVDADALYAREFTPGG